MNGTIPVNIKWTLDQADIDEYLERHGLQRPDIMTPALYRGCSEEMSCGAFIKNVLVGIVLGRRIMTTFQLHFIHATGRFKESVEEVLLRAWRNNAAHFNPRNA